MSGDTNQLGSGLVKRSGNRLLRGHKVNIYFVIDTTISMDDKIKALLLTCVGFVDVPATYNLDAGFVLVSFGDLKVPHDKIVVEVPLTTELEKIKTGLLSINRNWGGGNWGESSFEAIAKALTVSGRSGAVNVMILITDEPAHQRTFTATQVKNMLAQHQMLLYGLTPNIGYYREIIKARGGQWAEIDSSSSLDMLKGLFEQLARDVTETVRDVYHLTDGDVSEYLLLTSGDE